MIFLIFQNEKNLIIPFILLVLFEFVNYFFFMYYLTTYTVQICYKNYVGNNNDSRRHKKSQNHEKPVIGDSGWCGY